jgi:hypothetical protein
VTFPSVMVLERAIRDAGIPIDGVSIGDVNDRSTWRAFYQPAATAQQRAQGDQILATVDPQDATVLTELKADYASSLTNQDVLIALAQALWEAIPAPVTTLVQTRARFLALLKARL